MYTPFKRKWEVQGEEFVHGAKWGFSFSSIGGRWSEMGVHFFVDPGEMEEKRSVLAESSRA